MCLEKKKKEKKEKKRKEREKEKRKEREKRKKHGGPTERVGVSRRWGFLGQRSSEYLGGTTYAYYFFMYV